MSTFRTNKEKKYQRYRNAVLCPYKNYNKQSSHQKLAKSIQWLFVDRSRKFLGEKKFACSLLYYQQFRAKTSESARQATA